MNERAMMRTVTLLAAQFLCGIILGGGCAGSPYDVALEATWPDALIAEVEVAAQGVVDEINQHLSSYRDTVYVEELVLTYSVLFEPIDPPADDPDRSESRIESDAWEARFVLAQELSCVCELGEIKLVIPMQRDTDPLEAIVEFHIQGRSRSVIVGRPNLLPDPPEGYRSAVIGMVGLGPEWWFVPKELPGEPYR